MTSISVTPGKNNIGAYINNINLNKLEDSLLKQIKETLSGYGVIFMKKLKSQIFINCKKHLTKIN